MMNRRAAAAAVTVLTVFGMQLVDARGPPKLKTDVYQMRRVMRAGEVLRLTCPVESQPAAPPLFTWSKDGDLVHVGWDRYRTNGDSLRVRDLERSDSGVFICRATNGFGTLDVKYLVYVYVDSNDTVLPPDDFDEGIFHPVGSDESPKLIPEDENEPPFMSIAAGTTVKLSCRSTGSPKPEVSWSKDGVNLMPMETMMAADSRDTLLLPEVTQSDGGRYTCKVSNRAGTITRHYVVNVDVSEVDRSQSILPPHPENTTAGLGGTASFLCHVHSAVEQHPSIQWLKRVETQQRDQRRRSNTSIVTHDGNQYAVLSTTKNHEIHTTPHGDGTFTSRLTLSGVDEADAGLYVCVIVSRHGGRSFRSAFLAVTGKTLGLREATGDISSGPEASNSQPDSGFIAVVGALGAVGAILFVSIIGFVVHRRRRSKSGSSPSSSGGTGPNGTSGGAVMSSLLASSGNTGRQPMPRRGYEQPVLAANVIHHQQRQFPHPHPHQQPMYSESIDRYPTVMMSGGAGLTMGQQTTACGSAASGSGGNGPMLTAGQVSATMGRDRFVVRHPTDSTSYSDYSSMSRTVGTAAMPSPHLYALQQPQHHHHHHMHQQSSPSHIYQHPLYQVQPNQAPSAPGPLNQIHYYEGC